MDEPQGAARWSGDGARRGAKRYVAAMDGALLGGCLALASTPERFALPPRAGWEQTLVGCACGGESFRLIGWPRATTGRGGPLWRTFTRAFREVHAALQPTVSDDPPFLLPLTVVCERCGREALLLDRDPVPERMPEEARALPREAHRCRSCRRSAFAVAVAIAAGPLAQDRAAAEVLVRCRACRQPARVAAVDARPGERERRLDLLYGRRDA